MIKKKLKITIFHCTLIYTGGGERIVLGQLEELNKRGYDVSCFTPILDKKRCYPDIISKYPISTFLPQLPEWFPLRYAIILLLTSLLIPFLAFRFRDTDLFIGENQPGTWLAYVTSRLLRKPYIIYTCHPNRMVYPRKFSRKQIWKNQPDYYWLSIFFEPFKSVLKFLDKVSFTGSKSPVLTNGYFIGREFARTYKTAWRGCPSGAPVLAEKKLNKNLNATYKGEIRVNKKTIKKPYFLFTGRHEVWKRIDLAIEAMTKIAKEVPRATLVVPGPHTAHTKDLIKLARKLRLEEKVLFIGQISQKDLAKLYQEAAVYLFPSKKEDFGIVMTEAMGAGVPVVAWNSGGPTDIVINGETGFLAKPFSLDDLSAKAIKLLKSPKLRFKMGRNAWKRVKEEFSWERHVNILEKEIKKALK